MESQPHHHHDGRDDREHVSIRTVKSGDSDGFAITVIGPFGLADLRDIPVNSHVLMLHIDPLTGRAMEIDGTFWEEGRAEEAEQMHPDVGDGKFAGSLMYVSPLTDDEAEDIATDVLNTLDLGENIDTTPENVVQAFRSGWLGEDSLTAMLQAAAKLGRGVNPRGQYR